MGGAERRRSGGAVRREGLPKQGAGKDGARRGGTGGARRGRAAKERAARQAGADKTQRGGKAVEGAHMDAGRKLPGVVEV